MAQTTKQALARALKKRAKHKSLDKITIVDIAEDCGVNRQTFYYHFHDIVDLVEWIFTREKIKAIDGKKMDESWQNGFLRAFTYVLENRAFIEN
ncbi:MAG: TetR family transcriptional regulator, partial [Anaerovoracaceae bacterium]